MTFFEFSVLLIPTSCLVIAYLFWFSTKERPRYFVALWLVLLCLLFIVGWHIWEPDHEISQFGSALIVSASIWLNGILMATTIKSNKLRLWVIPLSALLAVLSVYFCFYFLAVTNQIWGL
ncbi:hypothetical protein [Aliiglaciecola litoralis]|uniref:hypothetical protein n=1 Tax=Aliiglaciecola litoralis TaxID=582857 RepID=UPI0031D30639